MNGIICVCTTSSGRVKWRLVTAFVPIWAMLAVGVPKANATTVLSCSGQTTYVNIGDPAALVRPNNQSFTVESWVKFSSLKNRDAFFSKSTAHSASGYTYLFGFADGKVAAYNGSTWVVNASYTRQTNVWYHLAFSFDGTKIRAYVNGQYVGEANFTFSNKANNSVKIGGYADNSDINGYIADVRFWDRARSEAEISVNMGRRLYPGEAGLLGYWRLDDGGGSPTAHDECAAGSDGTLVNAGWTEDALLPITAGQALLVESVSTQFGQPVPAYGLTNGLAHGDGITCGFGSPLQPHPSLPGVRGSCAGYIVYSNYDAAVLDSGSGYSFVYTHSTNSMLTRLVWLWDEEYEVTIAASAGGGVSTNGGWYGTWEAVSVCAAADSGYHFSHWEGDVPIGMERMTNLTFVATGPVSLTARFGRDLYVSASGDDSNDGYFWASALQTVTGAIARAGVGDTIWLTNGVYSLEMALLVDKPIALRGYGGAGNTVITRNTGYETRLLVLSNDLAQVNGLCLSNGLYVGTSQEKDGYGGGVRIYAGVMRNCFIANNTCKPYPSNKSYGGGIYMDRGVVENCVVSGNKAMGNGNSSSSGHGGGIANVNGRVLNCVITNNSASATGNGFAHGGGVMLTGEGALAGSLISGNSATGNGNVNYSYGGGVYMTGAGLVSNCFVTANIATFNLPYGGGLYAKSGLITHCLIASNTVVSITSSQFAHGGGASIHDNAVMQNSLVFENRAKNISSMHKNATYGGGVAIFGSGKVEHCTIVRNKGNLDGTGTGDGVYISSGTLVNSIVSHNYDFAGSPVFPLDHVNAWQDGGTVTHCAVPRSKLLGNGNGNIVIDPAFLDIRALDVRLSPGSACIDAGQYNGNIATDFAGNSRMVDGNGDDEAVADMGALEAKPLAAGELRAGFTVSPEEAFDSLSGQLHAVAAGTNATGLHYAWDIDGDGLDDISGTDKDTIHPTLDAGYYNVRLTIRNDDEVTAVNSRPAALRVYPSKLYVSAAGSGTVPFDKPDKAGSDLRAVYAMAESGSEIFVDQGVYGISDVPLVVRRGVKIRGLAPASSVIERSGSGKTRLMMLWSENALLEGLTLRHGWWEFAGNAFGGAVWLVEGMVDRCVVSNNYIEGKPNAPGYGGGIYMEGGRVRNSLIMRNTVKASRGNNNSHNDGGGVYMTGGRVEHCTIVSNHATRVTGEQSDASNTMGGGLHMTGGMLVNSIIYHNRLGYDAVSAINFSTSQASPDVTYTCAPELADDPGGNGNRNIDPLFIDRQRSNFHLDPLSVCRNGGVNLQWASESQDLDGKKRIAMGRADMGCYEQQAQSATALILR